MSVSEESVFYGYFKGNIVLLIFRLHTGKR